MTPMPFGKYKGRDINAVPRRYLLWLKRNAKLWGQLRDAVDCVLAGDHWPPTCTNIDDIIQPWEPSEGEPAEW